MKVYEVLDKVESLVSVRVDRDDLLKAFNITETDLATNYFYLVDEYNAENQYRVAFTEFPKRVHKILHTDKPFKYFEDGIVSKHVIGKITYAYLPENKKRSDTCDYGRKFMDILVNSCICEVFLLMGFYDEACFYKNKYERLIKEVLDGKGD